MKEKANVTYAQAKEALEYSGGNMLDALIYLEEKGAIPRQENGSSPHAPGQDRKSGSETPGRDPVSEPGW